MLKPENKLSQAKAKCWYVCIPYIYISIYDGNLDMLIDLSKGNWLTNRRILYDAFSMCLCLWMQLQGETILNSPSGRTDMETGNISETGFGFGKEKKSKIAIPYFIKTIHSSK